MIVDIFEVYASDSNYHGLRVIYQRLLINQMEIF
jgi:hypothetical protein